VADYFWRRVEAVALAHSWLFVF